MYWLIHCMLLQIKEFLSRRNRLFPSCIIKEVQEYGELMHGVHLMLRHLEVTLTKHGLEIYSLVTIVSCRLTGASFVLRDGNMPHSTDQAMHTTSSREARIMIEDQQHIWRDGASASALYRLAAADMLSNAFFGSPLKPCDMRGSSPVHSIAIGFWQTTSERHVR